jgi:hypothetical protein
MTFHVANSGAGNCDKDRQDLLLMYYLLVLHAAASTPSQELHFSLLQRVLLVQLKEEHNSN